MQLQIGRFYRNVLGDIVVIMAPVLSESRAYHRGLRFIDHRGSQYTDNGSVLSKFYGNLDLIETVDQENMTTEECDKLNRQITGILQRLTVADRIYRFTRGATIYLAGADIIRGIITLPFDQRRGIIRMLRGLVVANVVDRLPKAIQ